MSFLGGLIDSFTGESAKRAINETKDNQLSIAGQTRDGQISTAKSYGEQARGYFQPFLGQGGQSYNLYNDTLGVNGADARTRAQDLYNSDDMLARQRDLDLKRTNQQLNAGGNYNRTYSTGPQSLADSRVRLQGYGNWQDRLQAGGQQGFAAANALAGTTQNEGNQVYGAYGNYGNAAGNAWGQYGQQMPIASNAFAQNVIGLAGTVARAFNPLGGIGNARSNQLDYQPGTKANGGFQTTTYRG